MKRGYEPHLDENEFKKKLNHGAELGSQHPASMSRNSLTKSYENDLKNFIFWANASIPPTPNMCGSSQNQGIEECEQSRRLVSEPDRNQFRKIVTDGNDIRICIGNKDNDSSKEPYIVENNESAQKPGIVTSKKCISCPEDPYIICQGAPEDVIASLKNNQPYFVKENLKFIKSHKGCASMEFYCNNCSCGPISDWDNAWHHFTGKNHKRNVKDSNKFMKILLCSTCSKLLSFTLSMVEPCEKELPQDLSEIFRKMYPAAKVRGPVDTEPKINVVSQGKKSSDTIYFIFSHIALISSFQDIFNELMAFGRNNMLDLISVVLVTKESDQTAYCEFAKANKSFHDNNISNTSYLNQMVSINGFLVKYEIVPFFDDLIKMKGQQRRVVEWSRGMISPSCEVFKFWNRLKTLVNSKIREMEETSKSLNYMMMCIEKDLLRATAGIYTVTSVDFFGSRMTGLALNGSDFDLQISIRESCTVRSLSQRCFYNCPWFQVLQVIPWAKVPIIKLLHETTQTMCDISLNNFNGVINSQLLRFYLEIDERVKWLVVSIKIWASMNVLTGSFAFTSYTLAWLVIFFLMQKRISLVPPVNLLRRLPCRSRNYLLKSFETGLEFSLDLRELVKVHNPKNKCRMNHYELLVGFFSYYVETLSLKEIAIDPFSGKLISRKVLLDVSTKHVTDGNLNSHRNINNYSLILIDPIKHSCNISGSVNKTLLNNFISVATETLTLLDTACK